MNNYSCFSLLILILFHSSIIINCEKSNDPNPLTSHILDTSRGKPAANVRVRLYKSDKPNSFFLLKESITNEDGRVVDLIKPEDFRKGTYKLYFDTNAYFNTQNVPSFYPYVEIVFTVSDTTEHYHVPLLLNPFGYSTYRGS